MLLLIDMRVRGNNRSNFNNNFVNKIPQETQQRREEQQKREQFNVQSQIQKNSSKFLNPQPTIQRSRLQTPAMQIPQVQKQQVQQNIVKPTQNSRQQRQRVGDLPTLDDIDNFVSNRRQMDYNEYYATIDPVSNPIKDKLKRSKLRDKKSKGLLGTVDNTSGNSVLDSYRNLGRKLLK
jgi:hypothetical protein